MALGSVTVAITLTLPPHLGQTLNMTVCTRRRVVEHHPVAISVHQPQSPDAHLALRLAPGLDRRLVHASTRPVGTCAFCVAVMGGSRSMTRIVQ